MGKGQATTTNQTTTAPNPQAAAAYSSLLNQAQSVASTPYQAYSGELTAPVNSQQQAGINNINANANFASPYVQQAAGLASSASQPLTAAQIQNYQNPYTQDVVNATQAQFNNQNAQGAQSLTGNAIAQGALGGNRTGVAQANLSNQQQLAQAPVIAGLYNQSYNTGLQTAAQQYQQNPLAAANSIANFGISGQGAALSGAGAQLGAGTLQQQTQQAQDTANYGQYQQAQAYPYQQTQWLAGIDTGVGSNLGGTSNGTTTGPAPNQTAQYLGAGLSAASLFLNRGGAVHGYAGGGGVASRQHFADGGVSGTPWSGGQGWIPTINIHGGSGAPNASAPSAPQQPAFDATKFASQLTGLGGKGNGIAGGSAYQNSTGNYLGMSNEGQDALQDSLEDVGLDLPAARGGRIVRAAGGGVAGYADGGNVSDDPDILERFARSISGGRDRGQRAFYNDTRAGLYNSDTAPEHGSTYGGVGLGLADRRHLQMHDAQGIEDGVRGYADGGAPDFDDRFGPAVDQPFGDMTHAQALEHAMAMGNPSRPVMVPANGVAPAQAPIGPPAPPPDDSQAPIYDDGQGPVRMYGQHPTGNPDALRGTSTPAKPDSGDDALPPEAAPVSGYAVPGVAAAGYKPPYEITPADYAPASKDTGSSFGLGWLSPNAKSGLLAAGLGMLASRSPFLGNAIGEGGLAGVAAYSSAEEKDKKAAEDAQKLSLEAKKAANAESLSTYNVNHKGDMTDYQEAELGIQKQKLAKEYKPTWGVIREAVDPITGLSAKTYGWIDPNKKVVTDSQGKPLDASQSPSPPATPPVVNPDGTAITGPDYLKSVTPDRAARAKMIGDYEESPSDLPTRGGVRAAAVADAKRYNPDFNEQNYAASQKAYSNFVGGVESRTVRSLNVATDHLATLTKAAEALKNGQIPLLNSIVNKYREETGSPLTTNFDSIKQAVSSEIAKSVVGGQTALQDRDEMSNRARNADSPEQLYGIFDQFTKLMGGQMKGLRQTYEAGTYRKDFDKFLLPETKAAFARVADQVPNTYQPGQAGQNGFTPPAGAIAQTHNGKTYYYDPNTKQPYPGQEGRARGGRVGYADGGAPVVNQPFGELSESPRPTPTQWLGNKLQDALEYAGAKPHVARHLTEGLSGVAGLTPLGAAGAAANAVDANARGDTAGAVQSMAGMLPGAGAVEREAVPVVRGALRNKFTGAFKKADAGTDLPANSFKYINTKTQGPTSAANGAEFARHYGSPLSDASIDPALVESNLSKMDNPMVRQVEPVQSTPQVSGVAGGWMSQLPNSFE